MSREIIANITDAINEVVEDSRKWPLQVVSRMVYIDPVRLSVLDGGQLTAKRKHPRAQEVTWTPAKGGRDVHPDGAVGAKFWAY